MVRWNFSVESNSQREGWEKPDVVANNFDEAIGKFSKKQLKQILEVMKDSQKKLDVDKKQKPKHSFEASISTRTEFGDTYTDLGLTLKTINADSLEELIEQLKKLKLNDLEKKAKKILNSKDSKEIRILPKKCTLSAMAFEELDYAAV